MSSSSKSSSTALRVAAYAGLTALAVGAGAAMWLHLARKEKRRKRKGASAELAPEILDALLEETFAGELTEELQQEFTAAVAWVGESSGLSNKTKLALYGCYKQIAAGDAPAEQPMGGMEASYKFEAWAAVRGMPKAVAVAKYVQTLDEAVPSWRDSAEVPESEDQKGDGMGALGLSVSTMGQIGDPDKDGDVDETPVGQLCERIAENDVDEARKILKRQPELAFQADKEMMTPLHWAADRGCVEVAELLVGMVGQGPLAASRLNAQDESEETPLHYAVNTDNEEIVKLLLGAKADPGIANEDGETPLSLAKDSGMEDLFET